MFNGEKKGHKIIGICVAGVQSDYVKDITMSICSRAKEKGYNVLLFNAFSDIYYDTAYTRGEASIYDLVSYKMLDALVILAESIKNEGVSNMIVRRARENGVPVISVDKHLDGCCNIVFNYKDTFEQIVRHVIEHHGCRRVNFIAGIKGNDFSEERVEAFKKVLRDNDIDFEPERLGYGDFGDTPTIKVVEDFLQSGLELPEAIICANDSMAISTCSVLKKHGYRVPEDIIVTGFDGIEIEQYNNPRLTTAAVDISKMGELIIAAVEDIQSGCQLPDSVEIPYEMRISQSCGCEKVDPSQVGDKIMELFHLITDSDGHETHMFSYLAKTVECHTVEEIARVMSHYSDYYCWVCTNSDFLKSEKSKERYNESFTRQMRVFMQSFDNKYTYGDIYDVKELLPDLDQVLSEHNNIMFSPLHFQDEVIGYVAVSFNSGGFLFQNTRRFINNTNQIMESFKNRQRLEKANKELARVHMLDPMTGIFNRRGFYKHAKKLMKKADKEGIFSVVFSVDMDDLKGINDNFGHTEGDRAIKALSSALEKLTEDGGICSRFGGDEFVVMMATDDVDKCKEELEQKLSHILKDYNRRSKAPYNVEVSIGCAARKMTLLKELDECISSADGEMYCHKRQHKSSRRSAI
ncbi:GGDEF domain-containing protein [Ruminococcus sp.]|uniref:GGDEF domain-containing protein n=1 Tax=Ruminococcus sp. TaxID=41978 RepID=UPI0025DBB638|nr:GGDEF domain-containing protein [Ruminococcus sp.]